MLWGAVLAAGAQARRQHIDDGILPLGFTVGRVSGVEIRLTLGQLQGVHPGDGHLGQHSREEQRLLRILTANVSSHFLERNREGEDECAAGIGFLIVARAFDPDFAPMCLDNPSGDGQTQPRASPLEVRLPG